MKNFVNIIKKIIKLLLNLIIKKPLKFILYFLSFIALCLILLFFCRNIIADYILEKSLSNVCSAPVVISNTYIKPFRLHLSFNKMEITDKDDYAKNVLELGFTEFSLQFKPLLAKKFIIDKVILQDLKFNVPKKVALKKSVSKKEKEEKSSLKENKAIEYAQNYLKNQNIPIMAYFSDPSDIKEILAKMNFNAVTKVDSLEKIIQEKKEYWQNTLEKSIYKTQISQLKNELKKVNLEDLDKIEENYKIISTTYQKAEKLFKQIKSENDNFNSDIKFLNNLSKNISSWVKQDYKQIENLVNLDKNQVQNVALALFGERISSYILKFLESLEKSKNSVNIQEKAPSKDKMPELPTLWIKEIDLSFIFDSNLVFKGKISDLTSNQNKINKASNIILNHNQQIISQIILDYRNNLSKEKINIEIKEKKLKNINYAKIDFLPNKIDSANLNLKFFLDINNKQISGNINSQINDLHFNQKSLQESKYKSIAQKIISKIDFVVIKANFNFTEDKANFKINSNLDNIISGLFKEELSEKKKEISKQINEKYLQEVKKYEEQINAKIEDLKNEILPSILSNNKQVEQEMDEIKKTEESLSNSTSDKIINEANKLLDKIKF